MDGIQEYIQWVLSARGLGENVYFRIAAVLIFLALDGVFIRAAAQFTVGFLPTYTVGLTASLVAFLATALGGVILGYTVGLTGGLSPNVFAMVAAGALVLVRAAVFQQSVHDATAKAIGITFGQGLLLVVGELLLLAVFLAVLLGVGYGAMRGFGM